MKVQCLTTELQLLFLGLLSINYSIWTVGLSKDDIYFAGIATADFLCHKNCVTGHRENVFLRMNHFVACLNYIRCTKDGMSLYGSERMYDD